MIPLSKRTFTNWLNELNKIKSPRVQKDIAAIIEWDWADKITAKSEEDIAAKKQIAALSLASFDRFEEPSSTKDQMKALIRVGYTKAAAQKKLAPKRSHIPAKKTTKATKRVDSRRRDCHLKK